MSLSKFGVFRQSYCLSQAVHIFQPHKPSCAGAAHLVIFVTFIAFIDHKTQHRMKRKEPTQKQLSQKINKPWHHQIFKYLQNLRFHSFP